MCQSEDLLHSSLLACSLHRLKASWILLPLGTSVCRRLTSLTATCTLSGWDFRASFSSCSSPAPRHWEVLALLCVLTPLQVTTTHISLYQQQLNVKIIEMKS